MARRRFFIDGVEDGRAAVRGSRAHHLCHVLRLRPGQQFELSDGRRLYLGRVTSAQASEVGFAIEQELVAGPELPEVTLLAAIFKFDRMEWMIEKATELGVSRITPVVAARTEKALAAAAVSRVERWRRIAWEAAQQARRLAPPQIDDPCRFDQALVQAGDSRRLMLDEESGDNQKAAWYEPGGAAVLLVGPEGGWTEEERSAAPPAGFRAVTLGPLILRAETAALAALSRLLLP